MPSKASNIFVPQVDAVAWLEDEQALVNNTKGTFSQTNSLVAFLLHESQAYPGKLHNCKAFGPWRVV